MNEYEIIKLRLLREELGKINNSKISLCELIVYDEIESELEEKITDEEFYKLFCKVLNAYLKDENNNLYDIVRYCIKHLKELDKLDTYTILMNY